MNDWNDRASGRLKWQAKTVADTIKCKSLWSKDCVVYDTLQVRSKTALEQY